ncbi:hypothetical protein K504DRAFT_537052 [Pleomassaria siparia CBS 279.74]|uniref:Uncharacterized protein n=1 Tax=Pleomassaria siparia CBS 279.74 TaxID=1314801 RepID=A0A6G1JYA0_9PLEO|nr:hypothetical protein K504DRAFT_537052 [Pleomassaria siparia CBS 279.74]
MPSMECVVGMLAGCAWSKRILLLGFPSWVEIAKRQSMEVGGKRVPIDSETAKTFEQGRRTCKSIKVHDGFEIWGEADPPMVRTTVGFPRVYF